MGVSINFSSTMRRMGKLHASGLSAKHIDKNSKKEKNKEEKQVKDQEQGVSVTISKEGHLKAEQLRKQKLDAIRQEKNETYSNLERVNSMIARLGKGEELSEEEQAFLTDEMKSVGATNYVLKRDHKITNDEYKYILEESGMLIDNYMKRVSALSDMQKQLEIGDGTGAEKDIESMMAKAKLDKEEKERLVKILREIFEQEEEEIQETSEEEADEGELTEEEIEEEENANTTEDNAKSRALDLIKRNKKIVDDIADDSRNSFGEAEICNEQMDKVFLETYDILSDETKTIEEKVEAYLNSNQEISDLLYEKLIDQAKGIFDAETAIMVKLEYNLHNDLDEVIKGGYKGDGSVALDMMLEFLTNNKFVRSNTYDVANPEIIKEHLYEVWE